MTKKLTIKQRQEIYEYLLTLNCPDLLAALIAKRAQYYALYSFSVNSIQGIIENLFAWHNSPEGFEFWQMMHEGALEIDDEVSYKDDFESPTELDFPVHTSEAVKITIIPPKSNKTPVNLSFSEKVKLFFGKWIYKV
jgi:hypothetical protein